MLSFDGETGEPFVEQYNVIEALQNYVAHKECDKIECSECGEPIPKEMLKDPPDQIEYDVG